MAALLGFDLSNQANSSNSYMWNNEAKLSVSLLESPNKAGYRLMPYSRRG